MNIKFTGRTKEIEILLDTMRTPRAEMVAVTGRRRVGKTHLVKQVLGERFSFEITGSKDTPTKQQLIHFSKKLKEYGRKNAKLTAPKNWFEAFDLLKEHLIKKGFKKKQVIFFDELPWLARHRSGFLEALGYFWNDWASMQPIVVVLCGSAASWMIRHLLHHKGGLHNRITLQLHLKPFTLGETESFLQSHNIEMTRFDICRLYFVTGGVPYYLEAIKRGKSVAQNINAMCFQPQGVLVQEFDKLYHSLFENANNHIKVVEALASKWKGLTRQELLQLLKWEDGGSMSRILTELEQSDFIVRLPSFGKQRNDGLYRVADHYTLFYLRFMQPSYKSGGGSIESFENTQSWKSWCGYAFENTCLFHINQIKASLEIGGVYTETYGYVERGEGAKRGIQIDLVLDRRDNIIELIEIKFHDAPYVISKPYAAQLRERRAIFRDRTGTRKSVQIMMIAARGVAMNAIALELVAESTDLNALFG
jgi:AAA+ ATPase superfamily predicted ATPase